MILALDFDGVIMDGTTECMLVAWNVFNNNKPEEFNDETLNNIPIEFKKNFSYLRNFVRHDGHFIVPFYSSQKNKQPVDYREFNEIFESIPEEKRDDFKRKFISYRSNVRNFDNDYWSKLHTSLINLEDIMGLGVDVRIVSGKDSESILNLLQQKNLKISSNKIHGRMVDKGLVLNKIKSEAEREHNKLMFIDDNLDNVIDATRLNIKSFWAFWGFHTEGQVKNAKRLNIEPIHKSDLVKTIISFKEKQ